MPKLKKEILNDIEVDDNNLILSGNIDEIYIGCKVSLINNYTSSIHNVGKIVIPLSDNVIDFKMISSYDYGIINKVSRNSFQFMSPTGFHEIEYDNYLIIEEPTDKLLQKIIYDINRAVVEMSYLTTATYINDLWIDMGMYKKYTDLINIKKCHVCGRSNHNYKAKVDGKTVLICESCFSRDFFFCNRCNMAVENKYKKISRDGYFLCEECDKRDYILGYHRFYPQVEFYSETGRSKTDNGKLFLGIELEIDGGGENNEVAKTITSMINEPSNDNFIYCSHDSSLTEGFEMITQPATLEYHKSLKNKYDKLFKKLIDFGYSSDKTTTCGLHIHFNRNFYKENEDLCIARLLYLIDKNWDKVVMFSRRNKRKMDRFAKKLDMGTDDFIRESNKRGNHDYHYYAVNLSNRDTIEFRMFKGSLNIKTFLATLEFVQACIICAKTHTSEEIQKMEFEELFDDKELKSYWHTRLKTKDKEN